MNLKETRINVRFVPADSTHRRDTLIAIIQDVRMLRDARMAAMRKLHRSVVWSGQSPVGAVHVGRGEIVWQDRCDAANGSKEPIPTSATRSQCHSATSSYLSQHPSESQLLKQFIGKSR